MATFVALDVRPYLGPLDLTSYSDQVNFGELARVAVPFTNFGSGGFAENKPGLLSGEMTVSLFQDFAAGSIDETVQVAGQYAFTGLANVGATNAVGDVAYLSRGYIAKYQPLMGVPGAAAMTAVTLPYDARILRGVLGHPAAARTATGTGTALAYGGPTATQSLYATLHVTAYSGLTNAVIKVQSDDAVGFPSATDRLTFSTVTAVGSQYASAVGPWNTETHHRVSWTLTGVGSVSFVVAFAVF